MEIIIVGIARSQHLRRKGGTQCKVNPWINTLTSVWNKEVVITPFLKSFIVGRSVKFTSCFVCTVEMFGILAKQKNKLLSKNSIQTCIPLKNDRLSCIRNNLVRKNNRSFWNEVYTVKLWVVSPLSNNLNERTTLNLRHFLPHHSSRSLREEIIQLNLYLAISLMKNH